MDRSVALLVLGLASRSAQALPPAGPRADDALVEQASHKLEAGDIDDALLLLQKAQDAAPTDARPHYLRGSALARRDAQAAIREYRQALKLEPTLAQVHGELGALLLDGGAAEEACAELASATRFDPALGDAWSNLAKCEARRDHADAAFAAFGRAEKLLPGDADVRIDHAMALRKAGRLDEALKLAREAVSLDGKSAAAQQTLGFVLQSTGKLDEAVAAFTVAARLDPRSAAALWALGVVERDRHHDEAALTAMTRALAIDPRPPIAIDLAGLQLQQGHTAAALETLQAASARHPRSLALQVERSKVLSSAGRCAEAREVLAKLPRQAAVNAAEASVAARCSAKRR